MDENKKGNENVSNSLQKYQIKTEEESNADPGEYNGERWHIQIFDQRLTPVLGNPISDIPIGGLHILIVKFLRCGGQVSDLLGWCQFGAFGSNAKRCGRSTDGGSCAGCDKASGGGNGGQSGDEWDRKLHGCWFECGFGVIVCSSCKLLESIVKCRSETG
jgi:hypothetical protein